MRLLFAAFDHAHPGNRGNYWAYAHPDLDNALLDRMYFDVIVPGFRSNPDLQDKKTVGGFATIGQTWACWFQRLDAGTDSKGRPGRFVIACAFVRRLELSRCQSDTVLALKFFATVAQTAPQQCPLPQPPELEIQVACQPTGPTGPLLTELRTNRLQQWTGPDAVSRLGNVVGNLSPQDELRAFIFSTDTTTVRAEILIGASVPKPDQTPPNSTPPLNPSPPIVIPPLIGKPAASSSRPQIAWASVGLVAGLTIGIAVGFALGKSHSQSRAPIRVEPGPKTNRPSPDSKIEPKGATK